MYTPPAFTVTDAAELYEMIRQCPLASFITATSEGPMATPLPMLLDENEGESGVLYAHLARPNPQWQADVIGHGLAVFMARTPMSRLPGTHRRVNMERWSPPGITRPCKQADQSSSLVMPNGCSMS